MPSFPQLDLMRCHLKWAYQRPLQDSGGEHGYVHEPIAAWLVRRGQISVDFEDGRREIFTPGEWAFPRATRGFQTYSKSLEILSIRFDVSWSHGEPLFPRSETIRIAESSVPTLLPAATALVASIRSGASYGGDWVMHGDFPAYWNIQRHFNSWLIAWYQAMTAHGLQPSRPDALDPKVRQALEWIEAQPLNGVFRESALAVFVGLSVSQLNKLFTQHLGFTPAAKWRRRRLEAARARLIGSHESVKAIAYGLGFSSAEYFTTWFRKHHRLPPSAYRRRYRPGSESGHWV